MDEAEVVGLVSEYLQRQGISTTGKLNVFDHIADDIDERSFIVDLATHPIAKKGNRTMTEEAEDRARFERESRLIDEVFLDLIGVSLFPKNCENCNSWTREHNPNPVVGIAVESENASDKYFLGSLLAASIAGRWGIVVAPDCPSTFKWVATIKRMMHKGSRSPIPSNVAVFCWPDLKRKIETS